MSGDVHAQMRGGMQADDVLEVVAGGRLESRDERVERGQKGLVELFVLIFLKMKLKSVRRMRTFTPSLAFRWNSSPSS